MANNPFQTPGNWFKGNLHTHTLESDGQLTPKGAVNWYKCRGYDFLAITDHNTITNVGELSSEGFITLKAVEIDCGKREDGCVFHIIGLNANEVPENIQDMKLQEIVYELRSQGALVFVCHPTWSGNDTTDFVGLKGVFGMEIFTYGAEIENHTGYATIYWDALLRRKMTIYGLAVDDSHWSDLDDYCGGWVMVKAPQLSAKAILEALEKGMFYSSSGPFIENVEVSGGKVYVKSTPAKTISFITQGPVGRSIHAPLGKELIEAEYMIDGRETYIRVVCQDRFGRFAWTNPIFWKGEVI